MRIAVLTHDISPFGHQYARVFSERGHPSQVWSISACESEPAAGVRALSPPGFKPWESGARLVPYLKTLAALRRAVREDPPDILFCMYLSSAGLMGCLSGHPRVVPSAQGTDVVSHLSSRFWMRVFRWEARRACLFHAVSEPLAEVLTGRAGVDRRNLVISPTGVDTTRIGFVEPACRPNRGEILCTRAHLPIYDQPTLVAAMALLKARGAACRLTFANCSGVEATKRLVRQAGLEDVVTFRDGYTYDELPAILAAGNVYVSTSLSDGMSQSLLEAMSSGLFPVVSDIPANRPWVEHGKTGLLFPPGDAEALAARLAEALARPDLRAAAAPLNRRRAVVDGDVYRQCDKLLAAFARCLDREGGEGGTRGR